MSLSIDLRQNTCLLTVSEAQSNIGKHIYYKYHVENHQKIPDLVHDLVAAINSQEMLGTATGQVHGSSGVLSPAKGWIMLVFRHTHMLHV